MIPVGIVVAGKKKAATSSADGTGLGKGASSGDISNIDPNSVPVSHYHWIECEFMMLITNRASIKEHISIHSLGSILQTST